MPKYTKTETHTVFVGALALLPRPELEELVRKHTQRTVSQINSKEWLMKLLTQADSPTLRRDVAEILRQILSHP